MKTSLKISVLPKELTLSDSSANKVITIMDDYKTGVKKLIADMYLTEEVRKVKIDSLINVKNGKLKQFLTEQQLQKIVPTTERLVRTTNSQQKQ